MALNDDGDDHSSFSSGGDFLSPFASLRSNFPASWKNEAERNDRETVLSKLAPSVVDNTSNLIGGLVSPIASLEDDEDDNAATAPYRRALSESMNSSFANERTNLLGNRTVDRHRREDLETVRAPERSLSWGAAVCILSGVHMGMLGLHDIYVRYISYRRGYESTKVLAWRLPWLSPSASTAMRFGALVPYRVLHGQAWRLLTSLCMSTSVVEFLLVVGAWHVLQKRHGPKRKQTSWSGLCYVLAAFTGQLWTMAWDPQSLSGALSWGTCGVLCAVGVEHRDPRQRFLLAILSAALVLLSLIEPTNSIAGSVGSSLLGAGFYGMGWTREIMSHREKEPLSERVRLLCGMGLLVLWILPVLWLAAAPDVAYYQ